ncbi:aminotransferase, partial [Bradyrhizobium sp. SHOUNA76]|nr:aminotransferase [Bradyrhizobium sp. SHOUNA76]
VASAAAAAITIGASDPPSTRIDAERRALPHVVRASPHYYNTEAEVDRLIDHIAGLARRS